MIDQLLQHGKWICWRERRIGPAAKARSHVSRNLVWGIVSEHPYPGTVIAEAAADLLAKLSVDLGYDLEAVE